ncbi:hypothetical protein HYALB_00000979 [Hymenoscyphus albidus]|uniref:Uncharacterized protein n=1 Tax=Hymenoscyphus albidus TaxID=595503 RepID=A0A9N9LZI8_9HELO|nr:hypothetical protein HYALB_00000979 [Hymenoscyphus albidus]
MPNCLNWVQVRRVSQSNTAFSKAEEYPLALEVYASKDASQKIQTFLLYYIVNPIIAMDVMRPSKQTSNKSPRLMDKAVIESIHTKIWKVTLGDPNDDSKKSGANYTRIVGLGFKYSVLND